MIRLPRTKRTRYTKVTRRAVAFACLAIVVTTAPEPSARVPAGPKRIVSLIPAVTEMLFAMGAGPQIVGVSSFDRFPPEVERVTKVGALLDPDLERIIALAPDLVIVFDSQIDLRAQLERAQIPLYVYSHAGLPDVTSTLRSLGARVGHGEAAAALARKVEDRIAAIRRMVAGRPMPRTLIVLGREPMALRGIYASGGVGFVHDMVAAAGGDNVFADVDRQAVQATTELTLARRPDVILELRGGDVDPGTAQRDADVWKALPAIPAVRTGRIVALTDDRVVVPGPRIADGLELIARALHPAAFKKRGQPPF